MPGVGTPLTQVISDKPGVAIRNDGGPAHPGVCAVVGQNNTLGNGECSVFAKAWAGNAYEIAPQGAVLQGPEADIAPSTPEISTPQLPEPGASM